MRKAPQKRGFLYSAMAVDLLKVIWNFFPLLGCDFPAGIGGPGKGPKLADPRSERLLHCYVDRTNRHTAQFMAPAPFCGRGYRT